MKYLISAFTKYFTCNGRASRKEYWMYILYLIILLFIAGAADAFLGILLHVDVSYVYTVVYLFILVPSFAISMRRIQDSGHSGWWVIVPLVNLYFYLIKGDTGINKYGPESSL